MVKRARRSDFLTDLSKAAQQSKVSSNLESPIQTQDLQADLRNAAARGDLQAVVMLHKILKNQPLQAGPESRRNALHWAAFMGHEQIVSYLLKAAKGMIDVNAQDKDMNTALHLIVQVLNLPVTKRVAIMTLLLSHGANPLLENAQKKTPLMSLLPLRNQIASDFPHLRNGMNNVISKIKMWIYDKARELNRTVTIGPNGEVFLDKTGVPFQDPRSYLAQSPMMSLYRTMGMATS